jgi:hypothetical protein
MGRAAADSIRAAQLREDVEVIAASGTEGRDTPSRGLDATARFLVRNLARWRVRPMGDGGSCFQRIALRRYRVDAAASGARLNGQPFVCGREFRAAPAPGSASGPLVYAGHGWVVPKRGINPYRNIQVENRIVLICEPEGKLPWGIEESDLQGREGEGWESPASYARRHGARGLIRIPSARTAARWGAGAAGEDLPEEGTVVEHFQAKEPLSLPSITAAPGMVEALFRGEQESGAEILRRSRTGDPGPSFNLNEGKKVDLTVAVTTASLMTQNVVAALDGSDVMLRDEYLLLGAHYDHLGRRREAGRIAIYRGADDNASGTAAILEIARALARSPQRPRRSLLFAWFCGEEKDFWGSRMMVEFSPVALERTVAFLNLDMVGRSRSPGDGCPANADLSGPDEIYLLGPKILCADLGAASAAVNRSYLNLAINPRYDDVGEPTRMFFRSDQFPYAGKGVPFLFYTSGLHEDYHETTDTPEKLDYRKLEKVARTVCLTAWELACSPTRPKVDRTLPAELFW